MTEKKTTKKKATRKKKEIIVKEKTLMVEELQQMKINYHEQAELNMSVELLLKDAKLLNMQKELLRSQIKNLENEVMLINNKASDLKVKKAGKQESHRNYVESLKIKYDIKGAFGYDPDTGVIQEE